MKITKRENYRITVEFDEPWLLASENEPQKRHDELVSRGNDVVRDIKRHIDKIGRVGVEWDTKDLCSFCGYGFEESGECCGEALAEVEKAKRILAEARARVDGSPEGAK